MQFRGISRLSAPGDPDFEDQEQFTSMQGGDRSAGVGTFPPQT